MATRVELTHGNDISRVRFSSENGIHVLSNATRAELRDAIEQIEQRPECRVVVFEAEGRTFIAGADIRELQGLSASEAEALSRDTQALFGRIEALQPATVAAIHAACAGGGFELTLACDLRFAATSAKIGLPEVTLGLIPGFGGTVRMPTLFGPAIARHVMLRGELLPAEEALQLGLVTRVWSDDAFRDEVESQLPLLVSRSPGAIRVVKRLLHTGEEADYVREAQAFGECFESPDGIEGVNAFLEKREAKWELP